MNTMLDTKKMTVEEIKNYLMIDCGIPAVTVNNIKGKTKLVNFMKSLDQADNIFQQEIEFKEIEETMPQSIATINVQQENRIPNMDDPEWSNFVLSQLAEDEKEDKYPRTDGLRRLVEKLLNRITMTKTEAIQAPSVGNNYIATVRVSIHLQNGQSYDACADAVREFCPQPYNQHLSAIAETRAEGRVYRKILRLKNITTKEEMISQVQYSGLEKITKNQKNMISILAGNSRLNLNVKKLFDWYFKDKKLKSINQYSFDQATEICQILSDFQSDTNKIPKELFGYNSEWQNNDED